MNSITPEKTFRAVTIHLAELKLASALCYSSPTSRLSKSSRCWFVSGNQPLKKLH